MGELGGLHQIAAGEQDGRAVQETYRRCWQVPMYSANGWKVLIVNEADRMTEAAEVIWLDRLEDPPPSTIIIFTTNSANKLSDRLRDRLTPLPFTGDAEKLLQAACQLATSVAAAVKGHEPRATAIERLVRGTILGGEISVRRVLQHLEPYLL